MSKDAKVAAANTVLVEDGLGSKGEDMGKVKERGATEAEMPRQGWLGTARIKADSAERARLTSGRGEHKEGKGDRLSQRARIVSLREMVEADKQLKGPAYSVIKQ